MQQKTRRAFVGCGLLALSLLAGCGGGSSSVVDSPYRGAYAGTFQSATPTGVQAGLVTVTIGSDGKLTGSSNNTTLNSLVSTITGTVSSSGQANILIANGTGTATGTGTVSKTAANHLLGNINETANGVTIGTLTFDAAQQ